MRAQSAITGIFGRKPSLQEQQWEDFSFEVSQHGNKNEQAAQHRSRSASDPGSNQEECDHWRRVQDTDDSLEDIVHDSPGSLLSRSMMGRRCSTRSISSLCSIDERSEGDLSLISESLVSPESAIATGQSSHDHEPSDPNLFVLGKISPKTPEVPHRPRFRSWTPGYGNKTVVWDKVIVDKKRVPSSSDAEPLLRPLAKEGPRAEAPFSECLECLAA